MLYRGMDRAARDEDPTAEFDRAEQAYNEALRQAIYGQLNVVHDPALSRGCRLLDP